MRDLAILEQMKQTTRLCIISIIRHNHYWVVGCAIQNQRPLCQLMMKAFSMRGLTQYLTRDIYGLGHN